MTSKKYITMFFLVLGSFIITLSSAYGDIYWESEQVVTGIPGQPDKKKIIKNYFTPKYTRMDIGENVMIADFKTMTGYVLNTDDKMYLEMKMNDVGNIPEGLKKGIKVTPTNETRKIAGYNCRKYKISFMKREYEEWLSKEVNGYEELKSIDKKLSRIIRQNPLFQMGIIGKMDKLDGFPVQMIMPLGNGMTKIITLKKIDRRPLDSSVFKVPKGYSTSN
ncbi:DUF4412 [Desulfonema limicola]|uniref:DUF4412 n=1 Tax=Desulfonema limicola TaxID=45656 RepID=A0A975BCY9_9BACT|nr:DUF4412 domain-containing protein [Desulfonema limicola]QTA83078.1 DUF4412 [Desulfonema limicola]